MRQFPGRAENWEESDKPIWVEGGVREEELDAMGEFFTYLFRVEMRGRFLFAHLIIFSHEVYISANQRVRSEFPEGAAYEE